jgi:hypothetical protein
MIAILCVEKTCIKTVSIWFFLQSIQDLIIPQIKLRVWENLFLKKIPKKDLETIEGLGASKLE